MQSCNAWREGFAPRELDPELVVWGKKSKRYVRASLEGFRSPPVADNLTDPDVFGLELLACMTSLLKDVIARVPIYRDDEAA